MSRPGPPHEKAADAAAETPAAEGKAADPKKNRMLTGVAVGIGSAAIVAALLYANRSRRGDK